MVMPFTVDGTFVVVYTDDASNADLTFVIGQVSRPQVAVTCTFPLSGYGNRLICILITSASVCVFL